MKTKVHPPIVDLAAQDWLRTPTHGELMRARQRAFSAAVLGWTLAVGGWLAFWAAVFVR